MLKERTQVDIPIKNVCKMNHVDKSYFNPQVNLEIEGLLIPQLDKSYMGKSRSTRIGKVRLLYQTSPIQDLIPNQRTSKVQ